MKKVLTKKVCLILLAMAVVVGCVLTSCGEIEGVGAEARALTSNSTGTQDGFDYELWKDSGNVSMDLLGQGKFKCTWSNIGNVLFRTGKKLGASKSHNDIGQITIDYNATFNPSGNAYLCVYGWSKDPLVEYYIIESYGSWDPRTEKGAEKKGSASGYDLFVTTRNNAPSIEGNKTFKQYWAVRQSKRTSGTINCTEIFNAWYKQGMSLGKMYEVALTVEGYQSSGNAQINSYTLKYGNTTIGGGGSSSSGGGTTATTPPANNNGGGTTSTTTSSGATKVEAENMTKGGKYTGNCSSPFNGVILYANDDKVSFSQNFANNSHTFKVRGASNNDKEAQVQLKIGGTSYGTYKFKGTSATEQSITATHNKANQTATVELVCVNDNDTWDVKIDWIEISTSSGGSTGTTTTPPATNNNNNTTTNNNNTTTTTTGGATKKECEDMTKAGQYTGNISSPFKGVALYANNDKVSYSQNFTNNKHTFKLRGASNNNNKAQVQLKVGGTAYGTFEFTGTSAQEKSITVTHNQGGKTATVELICINDNNTWDAFIDWLEIQ